METARAAHESKFATFRHNRETKFHQQPPKTLYQLGLTLCWQSGLQDREEKDQSLILIDVCSSYVGVYVEFEYTRHVTPPTNNAHETRMMEWLCENTPAVDTSLLPAYGCRKYQTEKEKWLKE
ncbi:hypothetical protein Plhal304r1_c031g0101191 [Plasmopara halstedii]